MVRKASPLRHTWRKLSENWSKIPRRDETGTGRAHSHPSGGWRGTHSSRQTTVSPLRHSWTSNEWLVFTRSFKLPYRFVWIDIGKTMLAGSCLLSSFPNIVGVVKGVTCWPPLHPGNTFTLALGSDCGVLVTRGQACFSFCCVFRDIKTTLGNLNRLLSIREGNTGGLKSYIFPKWVPFVKMLISTLHKFTLFWRNKTMNTMLFYSFYDPCLP